MGVVNWRDNARNKASWNSGPGQALMIKLKLTSIISYDRGRYTFGHLGRPLPVLATQHVVACQLVEAEVLASRNDHGTVREICVDLVE